MYKIDHILWASPSLEEGGRSFEKASGVLASGGGAHPGFGTRNDLAALDGGVYFEIIAPDPAQADFGRRARAIQALDRPRLHTFAISGSDLDGYREAARSLGIETSEPLAMSRRTASGTVLNWRVSYSEDPRWGEQIPFFIDWQQSEHPSGSAPAGCSLKQFCALHPDADALAQIYRELAIPVTVARAPVAGFLLRLDTPHGEVVLT